MIGCTCSERQLAAVGCECIEMIVAYWPKGYPSEAGPSYAYMGHNADFRAEICKLAGPVATILHVTERKPIRPVETFSREYIREMLIGG